MDIINSDIEMIEKKFLAYLFHDKKYIANVMGQISKEHLPVRIRKSGKLQYHYQKNSRV